MRGTPSWSRGRGQGDCPCRRRHLDRIRFVAASLTVVFELPLSDVTVVDGEKAVLDCHVAVKPAAEVTGTSTRRSRCAVCAPAPTTASGLSRRTVASQPLMVDHSLVPRTLYDKPPASRGPLEVSDVTRSGVKFSWLAPTSNGGATIVTHVIEQSRAPVTDVDARRTGQAADRRPSDRFHGRRLTVTVTIRIGPDEGSLSRSPTPSTSRRTERRRRGRRTVARPTGDRALSPTAMDHPRGHGPLQHAAVTFSSRFNKGHLTSLPTTSRTFWTV